MFNGKHKYLGTVLFVDDEDLILNIIQDFFENAPFEVLTIESPQKALNLLDDVTVDLIISDYSMPVMNGIELLQRTCEKNPNARRVIVTGHMDSLTAIQTMHSGLVNNIYQKPLDLHFLSREIKNSLSLMKLIKKKSSLELMNSIQQIPTLPVYQQFYYNAIKDDDTLDNMNRFLQNDPAVTTEIIRLANTAFLGRSSIYSLEQALLKLEGHNLKQLLSDLTTTDDINFSETQIQYFRDVFLHLNLMNNGIHTLYTLVYKEEIPENFSSIGIFYQIGLILILYSYPERFSSVREYQLRFPGLTFSECEQALGFNGNTTAELSAYLLGWWNFPQPVLELSLLHKSPEKVHETLVPYAKMLNSVEHLVTLIINDASKAEFLKYLSKDQYYPESILQELSVVLKKRKSDLQFIYNNKLDNAE